MTAGAVLFSKLMAARPSVDRDWLKIKRLKDLPATPGKNAAHDYRVRIKRGEGHENVPILFDNVVEAPALTTGTD